MIFNRFFTPAHQSDDPQTRLKAIATLSPDKPQDKSILHELAFNDASSDVTIAALHQLNSFALWQKMAVIGQTERVKREAEKQVAGILRGEHDTSIPVAERNAFLKESASASLISELLTTDMRLHDDSNFVMALLARVSDVTLNQQVFHVTPNRDVQYAIIENATDHEFLTRLQRKVSDDDLSATLAARIESLLTQARKPQVLKQALTLCLSKYQALLDKSDYPEVTAKAAELEQEYQALMADRDCLSAQEGEAFAQKHERISSQISRHSERLKPQWQAAHAEQQVQEAVRDVTAKLDALAASVRDLYQQKLLSADAQEIAALTQASEEVAADLAALDARDAAYPQRTSLNKHYQQVATEIDNIGVQQKAAETLYAVLQQAENALSAEQDKAAETLPSSEAQQLAKQWREAAKAMHQVPQAWQARWDALWTAWNNAAKAERAALQKQYKACKKQLNIIDSQIEQGRFKAAMRGFQQLRQDYQTLSDSNQSALYKRYQQTETAVERLEGWQSYIASPRKPALLDEARALAAQTPADIAKRAEAIRYLRQQWNSLGNTADEQDAARNAEFDTLLETAFEPCRAHYAKQEAQREEIQARRRALIAEVGSLPDSEAPAELAKQLDRLRDKWHHAGQLDKPRYAKLKAQWDEAIAPHQQRVMRWYEQNRVAKQALIAEAKALLDYADSEAAASEARQLQQRWKQTGQAGRRAESSLWHSFKAVNDTLFARVKAKRQSDRQADNAVAASLMDKVDALAQAVSRDEPGAIREAAREIEAESASLAGSAKRGLSKKLGDLNQRLEKQANEKRRRARQAQYDALRVLLESWHQGEARDCLSDSDYQALGKRWRRACEADEPSAYTRSWLTTALEIQAAVPSPDKVAEERQAVQLELLSAKLAQGEKWTEEALIAHWLSPGPIAEEERSLAQRLSQLISQRKAQ